MPHATRAVVFGGYGTFVTSLVDAHSAWRQRADEFSDTLKTTILFGQYALNTYRGHYYAKSQNLARTLRAAYDVGATVPAGVKERPDRSDTDERDRKRPADRGRLTR